MRISSPPYRWPCFYGMDTGTRAELIAANLTTEEIRDYLGLDSIAYLELDRLIGATGAPRAGFCTACLDGNYPVEIPRDIREGKSDKNSSELEQISISFPQLNRES
jgi:amidophosphoribosyltransferase